MAKLAPLAFLAAACLEVSLLHAATDGLPTYRAIYDVQYRGETAGSSEVTVSYDPDGDHYEYASATRLQGVYKLLVPGVVSVRSEFEFENGSIIPLRFWHTDGKNGSRESRVEFDWERLEAALIVKM